VGSTEWAGGNEMELHSEGESYRATIQLRTPDGDRATLLVLRRGCGRSGRVWLTFDGAVRTTVMMDDGESGEVSDMIKAARRVR
jgi:hypothetical protein